MKIKAILVSFLLSLSFFIQFTPIAYAAGPTIDKQCNNGIVSGTSIACTIPSVPSGDFIVVATQSGRDSGVTLTLSDNASNTYTSQVHQSCTGGTNCAGGSFYRSDIWTMSPASVHGLLITFQQSGVATTIGLEAYAVSSITATPLATAVGVCIDSCGTSVTTSTSISVDGTFALGSSMCVTCGTMNPGTLANFAWVAIGCGGSCNTDGSEKTVTATGSVNFQLTEQSSAAGTSWTLAAATFGVVTNVTVTAIGPCTFFELQCWWYPLLFMGLYSGYILYVGQVLRTSSRGKSHLFLSAVTFGSLVAVIFGIMNIVFPLLMLVLNTVIALRLRG